MKMLMRLLRSLVSGLSLMMVFCVGMFTLDALASLIDYKEIVWERRSPMTQLAHSLVLTHDWQWATSLPLLLIGFTWLAWQADEPAMVFYERGLFSFIFVAVLAGGLPLLAHGQLVTPKDFHVADLIVPMLSALPLCTAIFRHRAYRTHNHQA
jgi:hypothetical protein